jgi:tripartite-type tricarboxylate transporter receptor subunit TctC
VRKLLMAAALTAAALGGETPAPAQDYPTRPITLIVPFPAGGGVDAMARIIADRLTVALGQQVIIDNRGGVAGVLGMRAAAKAVPDGYTLVASGSGPMAANRTLYRDLGYDPETDFEHISPFAYFTIVVAASTKLSVKTLSELIAYAKANPGLNYGSVGIGSSQHLSGAYFEQVAGVQLTHVPYRNIAQYGPDMIAGTVPLGFQWLPNVNSPLKADGARALAVASKKRMAALPDVPTTAEAGLPQYEASGWFALQAPRGTPKAIVAKLNHELAAAATDPVVRQKFLEVGAEPDVMSPEEAKKFISAETVKWRDIITNAGIPQIQ